MSEEKNNKKETKKLRDKKLKEVDPFEIDPQHLRYVTHSKKDKDE